MQKHRVVAFNEVDEVSRTREERNIDSAAARTSSGEVSERDNEADFEDGGEVIVAYAPVYPAIKNGVNNGSL